MSQITDFKEYLKYKPEYKEWKNERDIQNKKKNEYLKNNSIPKDEFNKDIERAKIVLNAVDVMDEYSQSRAEEMEQVTESIVQTAAMPISYLSMGLAALSLKFTKV